MQYVRDQGFLGQIQPASEMDMMTNALAVIGSYNSGQTQNLHKVAPNRIPRTSGGNTEVSEHVRDLLSGSSLQGNYIFISSWLANHTSSTRMDAVRRTEDMSDLLIELESFIHRNVSVTLRSRDFYAYNTQVGAVLQQIARDVASDYERDDDNVTAKTVYLNLVSLAQSGGLIV